MKSAFMFTEAWRALGANRLRTLLTMLGMIIGVAAVILMLAVGSGAQFRVNQAIASLGSNLFVIWGGAQNVGGVHSAAGTAPSLTLDDARAVAELPDVGAVSPQTGGGAQVVYGQNNWNTGVEGTTPGFLQTHNWELAEGRMFTNEEVQSLARVAVLGQTVATNLFGSADPVGKTIRIGSQPFMVVGLLSIKGQSMNGSDQDDTVLVPVTTALSELFGSPFPNNVRIIMAQAASAELMGQAQQDIDALLRQRHHLTSNQPDDFSIRNLSAATAAAADSARSMSLLLAAIAAISLVVGGIGIMNIMYVSVTERTREIGIRVAVGARRRDVLLQFLLEAIFVSVSGCLVGICIGILVAALLQWFAGLTVIITLVSIILAFGVSVAVGVFFGYYPARKASRMKPIDALRFQ